MRYFAVFVEDHISKERVCVLDMATRQEAVSMVDYLTKFSACAVYFIETTFIAKRGKEE